MLAAKHHHQLLAFMETFIVSMLYSSIFFIASLFTAPGMTQSEESQERYWSGKPQAIGIDLSPSLLHAVQYISTAKSFTNLASIPSNDQYGLFMYELYQRQQVNGRNHHDDYFAYEKWWPLRNIVHSSFLTSWVGDWIPQLSNEYRYRFNNNLDELITNPSDTLAWTDRLKSVLPWQISTKQQASKHENFTSERLPLNTTNFVNVIASALESLKIEVLKTHDINITSAVITTPYWIYNEIDKLIERACLQANVELLDKKQRDEAARYFSSKADKSKPLILEQYGYDFRLSKVSSSGRRDDLSASWIPAQLTGNMLKSLGFVINSTTEALNAATQRLAIEIAKARQIMKYAFAKDAHLFNEEETTIVIPDFGSDEFTFTKSLSGAEISRVEESYMQAVQQWIETNLLKHDEIHTYKQNNNLIDNPEEDPETLFAATVDLAKTVPHPQAASGGSWWESIDSVLVLADFPDNELIRRAAMRAMSAITSSTECSSIFSPDYLHYNLVARGAAQEAATFVEAWESEEQERRRAEDGDADKCWDDGNGEEEGWDGEDAHGEL